MAENTPTEKEKVHNKPSSEIIEDFRMYKQELPNKDDLVVVRINKVEDFGAFVSLLEYNNKEGMILSSEVSRKRIRSIHKHLRIAKQDVMQVLRVDKEKGYIDLSKKYVTEEDVKRCTEFYTKSKTVYSIMKHVAVSCGLKVVELLEKVAWPLYDKYSEGEPPGHALTGLTELLNNEDLLKDIDLPENVKQTLLKEIRHRLAEKPVKVQAIVEVCCFTEEGIDAIKPSLLAGKKVGKQDQEVEIHLVSTPQYRLTTQCMEKQHGIDLLNAAIEAIKAEILAHKGTITVKEEPVATE